MVDFMLYVFYQNKNKGIKILSTENKYRISFLSVTPEATILNNSSVFL